MKRTVHYMGEPPAKTPKAVKFADIKGQGKIPYGETTEFKIPSGMKRSTARGMGAAKKGGEYWSFK